MHDCWIKMQSCSVSASYWSLKVVNVTSTRNSSSPITALNGITNKESFLVLFFNSLSLTTLLSYNFRGLLIIMIKLQVGRKDGTLTLHSGESARWLSFSFDLKIFGSKWYESWLRPKNPLSCDKSLTFLGRLELIIGTDSAVARISADNEKVYCSTRWLLLR